jgi:hypothetical protein
MRRIPPGNAKWFLLPLFLAVLILPSLSCTAISGLVASPTPTATATPEPTATPQPTPTVESILTREQRSQYLVILRYIGPAVGQKFAPIQDYLQGMGYKAQIDEGPSNVGDMDIILFGALNCNTAIDDLEGILAGKLDITRLTRMRFLPADTGYLKNNIVIQIRSTSLFGG